MRPVYVQSPLDQPALVLNRSWIAIHVTSVRRALCLVYGGAAVVVDAQSLQTYDFESWSHEEPASPRGWVRAPGRLIATPEIIQLRGYNKVPAYEAPFTRKNLFERDDHRCQYCGARCRPDRSSIDHVTPRSKGGQTSWDNCVLACVRCNSKKADRSLRESGLRLQRRPKPPRWTPYLNLRRSDHLDSWAQFTTPARHRS